MSASVFFVVVVRVLALSVSSSVNFFLFALPI